MFRRTKGNLRKGKLIACCLVSAVCGCGLTFAQQATFNSLTIKNGLSSNAVISIAQDKSGFMWLGTNAGLNRYDGHHFKLYQNTPNDTNSLRSNYILSLLCDSKGGIWVGTTAGLDKYVAETDHFVHIQADALHGKQIKSIFEDSKENLWVGTSNGLVRLNAGDNATGNAEAFYFSPDNRILNEVNCIYEDDRQNLWVGLTRGVVKADLKKVPEKFEAFNAVSDAGINFRESYITTIIQDRLNNLWMGTQNNGVFLYNEKANTLTHYSQSRRYSHQIIHNSVRKLLTDATGRVWVGTQDGITIIDPETGHTISYQHQSGITTSLTQNSVHALFMDRQNSVWIGTYFGGVNIDYAISTPFNNLESNDNIPSLSSNIVSSIREDDHHNLWIGTHGGGLNYYNRATGRFTYYRNIPGDSQSIGSNLIHAIYIDRDKNLMIGTHGGGVNILAPGASAFTRILFDKNNPSNFNSNVAAIQEDSYNRFWFGGNAGIKLFRKNNSILSPLTGDPLAKKVSRLITNCFFEDSARKLWIGAASGLYYCMNDTVIRTSMEMGVNCIMNDTKGNLWVGTIKGLVCYDQNKNTFRLFATADDVPGNNIIGILEDSKDNLWLSTDNGLTKFNTVTHAVQTFTTADGLADNQFNRYSYFKDSNGEFFFGGLSGITHFYPDSIMMNANRSSLVFTDLKIFNNTVQVNGKDDILKKNISLLQEFSLEHRQNVFTIEFALLNFIKSGKNRYAYMLKGYDKDWISTDNPSAAYTNVLPGSYEFLVKAANNDGIWTDPVKMNVKISPPLWKTWWAYAIYTIVALAVLFFIIQYFFLKEILKREEALHELKLNFFAAVSHEIRTHLTLIMIPLDKIVTNASSNNVIAHQLTSVKTKFYRLLRLVTELMDFQRADTKHLQLKVSGNDLVTFLKDIFDSFQEISVAKNIRTTFSHNTSSILLNFDPEQLEKVFFNLLMNAFKFTAENGKVEMNIVEYTDDIAITVKDNGKGIPAKYKDKLFANYYQVEDYSAYNTGYGIGLALAKNITELHAGTISVESEAASGQQEGFTCFTVILPKRNNLTVTNEADEKYNVAESKDKNEALKAFFPDDVGALKQPQHILIVEDNAELRAVVKEELSQQFDVIEADNGLAGWEIAVEQIPDLIISDIIMPQLDGIELSHRLKTDQRTSHIPLILLTAKSAQSDIEEGLETGADVYVNKPFSSKAILLNTRNLLVSRERARVKFESQFVAVPGEAETIAVDASLQNTVDREFLTKLIDIIEDRMDSPGLTSDMLSRKMAMSLPVLYKKVKALTNMTVNDFIKSLRLKKAAILLQQKRYTVNEICYMVGYSDRRYFSKEFKKHFGKTPTEFGVRVTDNQ